MNGTGSPKTAPHPSRPALRTLDLFSGIGGFSLGFERTGGFKTVAFCEIEEYPRRILAKHWPDVPIHHDVRKLKGSDVGPVDVICGGYPCQPFSLAGQRRGAEDDRHLWPEMYRLVDELRPSWVIGENVAGHAGMGLDAVLSDLESLGYACRPFVIPAVALDARHRRDRIWIVAHANGERGREAEVAGTRCGNSTIARHDGESQSVAYTDSDSGREGRTSNATQEQGRRDANRSGIGAHNVANAECFGQPAAGNGGQHCQTTCAWQANQPRGGSKVSNTDSQPTRRLAIAWSECDQWLTEPDVGRVAHGVPSRVDRLRGLGNAVVPQIPEAIGRAILAAEAA